jgi:multidrug efflux pump subunit AcrA (membrane-fusion protein)
MLLFSYISLSATDITFAKNITIKRVKKHLFLKKIELNAKVVQLSNAKQAVMAQISGHIEKYFVSPNQKIKKGDKIALLKSVELSKLTADYIAIKKQYDYFLKRYQSNKKLFEKGLISLKELTNQSIQKETMLSKLDTLRSSLKTLGIDTKTLKKATSDYILYSHNDGVVSQLLQPLHAVVDKEEQIVSIIQKQAFYIESYLPIKYAPDVKIGDKLVAKIADESIVTKVTQILPKIDQKSQRVILLSKVTQKTDTLYIGAYIPVTLYSSQAKEYMAVERSALSFFNNEWVVFVPKEDHHKEHKIYDEHEQHDQEQEDDHDDHEELPYDVKVVNIVAQDEMFVGVEGLNEGDEYVANKSYFIKSMLLKSSLGGHGH